MNRNCLGASAAQQLSNTPYLFHAACVVIAVAGKSTYLHTRETRSRASLLSRGAQVQHSGALEELLRVRLVSLLQSAASDATLEVDQPWKQPRAKPKGGQCRKA